MKAKQSQTRTIRDLKEIASSRLHKGSALIAKTQQVVRVFHGPTSPQNKKAEG